MQFIKVSVSGCIDCCDEVEAQIHDLLLFHGIFQSGKSHLFILSFSNSAILI